MTTLRDGSQSPDISFSVGDKLAIAEKLDELGMHYIEGGFTAIGNAKDQDFFKAAKRLKPGHRPAGGLRGHPQGGREGGPEPLPEGRAGGRDQGCLHRGQELWITR